jgi:hypothetical protein
MELFCHENIQIIENIWNMLDFYHADVDYHCSASVGGGQQAVENNDDISSNRAAVLVQRDKSLAVV